MLAQVVDAHDLSGSVYCTRNGETWRVSDSGASTPIWSPDGRGILYHDHPENTFRLISPDGESLKTIPVPPPLTFIAGMSWHPDGMEIAFGGSDERDESFDIYSLNLEDGKAGMIMPDGIQPAWSKDGLLAFTTYRDGNLEVYLADREGRLRNLTRHDSPDARPSWLPDGTRIAFETSRYGNLEVCVVDFDGKITRLTDDPGKDWNPAWSSKGEMAFVSTRDGTGGIYLYADGTAVTRLPSHESDWQLSWSPDGECLCFVSDRPEPFFPWLVRWLDIF